MGRWLDRVSEITAQENKLFATKHENYIPVKTISLVDGWLEIESGKWQGVGLLDVLEENIHVFGKQVIVAESDHERLREQFPQLMIFTPDEFKQLVNDWPDSKMTVYALRRFDGQICNEVH